MDLLGIFFESLQMWIFMDIFRGPVDVDFLKIFSGTCRHGFLKDCFRGLGDVHLKRIFFQGPADVEFSRICRRAFRKHEFLREPADVDFLRIFSRTRRHKSLRIFFEDLQTWIFKDLF